MKQTWHGRNDTTGPQSGAEDASGGDVAEGSGPLRYTLPRCRASAS
jgi:hypothetical protein